MENIKTLEFLNKTRLAVIACADENMLNNFITVADAAISVETGIGSTVPRKAVSQKLATTIKQSKTKNTLVPFKYEKYSELRSIYFYLPENVKSDVQIFVLKETETGVKLECELGLLQGSYILYDYTKLTGEFKEKG